MLERLEKCQQLLDIQKSSMLISLWLFGAESLNYWGGWVTQQQGLMCGLHPVPRQLPVLSVNACMRCYGFIDFSFGHPTPAIGILLCRRSSIGSNVPIGALWTGHPHFRSDPCASNRLCFVFQLQIVSLTMANFSLAILRGSRSFHSPVSPIMMYLNKYA